MKKKKIETKLAKAKKKLVKAEGKVAQLEARLSGDGKAMPSKKASKSAGRNGKAAQGKTNSEKKGSCQTAG